MLFADTDVLIAMIRMDPEVTDRLERAAAMGEELGTTSVNVGEVLRGAHRAPSSLAYVNETLEGFTEVPVGPRAARRFGQLMSTLDSIGRRMPEMDGLIAAVVLEEGGRLLTGNTRHFAHVPGLEVLSLR